MPSSNAFPSVGKAGYAKTDMVPASAVAATTIDKRPVGLLHLTPSPARCAHVARRCAELHLRQVAAVAARGLPGGLVKSGGERTRFAKAEGQADFGHRVLPAGQQHLRLLDPPVGVVAVRRDAERLFECPAEIIGAQAREPREPVDTPPSYFDFVGHTGSHHRIR